MFGDAQGNFVLGYQFLVLSDELISSESTFHLYKVRSEIESGLCGLVIGYVLGSDTDSVYWFFEEGVESVFGRDSRHIESERSVVFGA